MDATHSDKYTHIHAYTTNKLVRFLYGSHKIRAEINSHYDGRERERESNRGQRQAFRHKDRQPASQIEGLDAKSITARKRDQPRVN